MLLPEASAKLDLDRIKNSHGLGMMSLSDLQTWTRAGRNAVLGRFASFEEFAEAIRSWDLDFIQVDAGPSASELFEVVSPRGCLMTARLGRRYVQEGGSPPGFRTFALPTRRSSPVTWCGSELKAAHLAAFEGGGSFRAHSIPGFEVITLSFPVERLLEIAKELECGAVDRQLEDPSALVAECDAADLDRICQRVGHLRAALLRRPAALGSRSVAAALEVEIPTLIVSALAGTCSPPARPDATARALAVRRALEYIEGRSGEPIAVREVADAARVSWRLLDYAFRDHFGMTPKAYLQSSRLNGLRRELRDAPPGMRVADAASRWGFWHMGQLAADYHRRFGELPSETLASRR